MERKAKCKGEAEASYTSHKMHITWRKINISLVVVLVVLMCMMLGVTSVQTAKGYQQNGSNRLIFDGEYAVNDGEYRTMKGRYSIDVDNETDSTVVHLRGHFSSDIDMKMIVKLSDITCKIKVNGIEIFESEPADNTRRIKTPGDRWEHINDVNITTTDDVEIELVGIYNTGIKAAAGEFLRNLYQGYEKPVFMNLMKREWLSITMATGVIVVGLVNLLLAVAAALFSYKDKRRMFPLAFFIIACGLWFAIKSEPISFLFGGRVLSVLNICCQYMISIFGAVYTMDFCTGIRKKILELEYDLCIAYAITMVTLNIFGVVDPFDYMKIGVVENIILLSSIVGCVGFEMNHHFDEELKVLAISMIPVLVTGVAEIVNYGIGSIRTTTFFTIGFLLYAVIQMGFSYKRIRITYEAANHAKELEMELMESRMTIMLSQIQPHFLFNSLSAIKVLCDENPKKASEVVNHFSHFLRGNIDSLSSRKPIMFEKELEHVKNYLYIEEVRFSDSLSVQYDIQEQNFLIPPLTIQPIVENAVKYGVTKKDEGGTVTISTRRVRDQIIITIADDGVGFDTKQKKQDGRSHVGMDNVRSRIESLCGGTLTVQSEIGKGTTVTIQYPYDLNR